MTTTTLLGIIKRSDGGMTRCDFAGAQHLAFSVWEIRLNGNLDPVNLCTKHVLAYVPSDASSITNFIHGILAMKLDDNVYRTIGDAVRRLLWDSGFDDLSEKYRGLWQLLQNHGGSAADRMGQTKLLLGSVAFALLSLGDDDEADDDCEGHR